MLGKRIINTGADTGAACTTDTVQILGDTSCVAYYKMSDATDETGSYDGTATDVNFNVAGKFGNAGEFNGSSSVINFTSSFLNITTDFTVSGWMNQDSSGASLYLFACTDTNSSNIYFNLNLQSSQNRIELIYNNVGYYPTFTYQSGWHHYAVTLTGTSLKTYINGSLFNTQTVGISSSSGNRQTIGARLRQSNSSYGVGKIDQVRIFDRAITANEVTTLYNEVQCIPTIVPTDYFEPVIYTGNGTTQSISSLDFKPDMVWTKARTVAYDHGLVDSVRGVSSLLYPSLTAAATTTSTAMQSFDSNGFTWGSNNKGNASNSTYVAWNWKAGGTAVSNTDGDNNSAMVSANPDAGFSIITYTGTGTNNSSVGHGLDSKPEMFIYKRFNSSGGWGIVHKDVNNYKAYLAFTSGTPTNDTNMNAPTDEVIRFNTTAPTYNGTNQNWLIYAFHSVDGYSKVGSYVGTGGNVNIVTGFRPATIIIKRTDNPEDWKIIDNKRGDFADSLEPNESIAEEINNNSNFQSHSNGFTIGDTHGDYNANGGKYIFLAIAEENVQPEPELANSFNVVTYQGDGGTQNVNTVGFQPDLVWIKCRNVDDPSALVDSVRGASETLFSDNTNNQRNRTSVTAFNSNGFTLGNYTNTNRINDTYVAWCWKASNDSTINNEGSISSVVSANPAAGFSVCSYTGLGSDQSFGHGLSAAPEMVIIKRLDNTSEWNVHLKTLGTNNYLNLNTTAALNNSTIRIHSTDSTVVNVGGSSNVNGNGGTYVSYCFHSVDFYQRVGTYEGNGVVNTIYTDSNGDNTGTGAFQPRWVMIKNADGSGNWMMYDAIRDTDGTLGKFLEANTSDFEADASSAYIVPNSTGWTTGSSNSVHLNQLNNTYIYLAIA